MHVVKIALALCGVLFVLAVVIEVFQSDADDRPRNDRNSVMLAEKPDGSSTNIDLSGYSHTHITGDGPVVEGSGVRAQDSRDLDPFDRVEFAASVDFKITRGGPGIIIIGDDNIVPLTSTDVQGNTLVVSFSQSFATNRKVQMVIATPGLRHVAINGSADGFLDAVTDESMDINISGSGDLGGIGAVEQLNVRIAGSGSVLLHRLAATHCRITINGSGDGEVHATESLNATVNGSGDVKYSGAPKQVHPQVSGSGSIRPVK